MFGYQSIHTEDGEFSFVTGIVLKNRTGFAGTMCTGALISPKHVLLSAHCLHMPLKELQVAVGSRDLKAAKRYDIKSAITYKEWSPTSTKDYDVAILTVFYTIYYFHTQKSLL